jgi:hypothetical protein
MNSCCACLWERLFAESADCTQIGSKDRNTRTVCRSEVRTRTSGIARTSRSDFQATLHIRRNAKRFASRACSEGAVRRSGLCEECLASRAFFSRRCQNPGIRVGDICGPTKAPPHRGTRHAPFSRGGVDERIIVRLPRLAHKTFFPRHSRAAQPLRATSPIYPHGVEAELSFTYPGATIRTEEI